MNNEYLYTHFFCLPYSGRTPVQRVPKPAESLTAKEKFELEKEIDHMMASMGLSFAPIYEVDVIDSGEGRTKTAAENLFELSFK